MRKVFVIAIVALFSVFVNAADISRTIPPNYFVRTTAAEFTGDDSTYTCHMENGRVRAAKGFMVRPGVSDSAIIMIQPSGNSLEKRTPIKVRAIDVGERIAVGFSKIYRSGTTPGILDSIECLIDN